MHMEFLIDAEIARPNWAAFREADGPASGIPNSLRRLIKSTTNQEADAAYWELENHVFVQGRIYDSALPTVSVILAALVNPYCQNLVVCRLLDLLFYILRGVPDHDMPEDLNDKCKTAAREGLWMLYRIYQEGGQEEAAAGVIELLDDTSRLNYLRESNLRGGASI